ncbi:MAG TPA: outer membrane protein assembly factor BamA [Burkholderiales bacterium]|nr:outer membrane protein assembly factor BamA [Burkholderiales bacterium]
MKNALRVAIFLLVLAQPAWGREPFVVRDIRVEGIQRIEAGTVFNYLPVKVGDTMTDEKAAAAIRALFATGFFRDVRLEVQGGLLIVGVEERPAIASIDFSGMKEFEKDKVKQGLRDVGFQDGRIFDRALLDQAEQELKRQYLTRALYAVEITTTVTPLERNRVAINFSMNEGEAAKIKRINIVGNRAFSESELQAVIQLRTPGLFTWFSKNDQYSRQKLQADLESLRSYYLNNGYLEFNIDSTQVSITPDRHDIYITANITEGEKYTVANVKLGGDLLVPEDELRALITLKPGDTFSREKLTDSTKAISDRLGRDGYAFANVNATPDINKEKREVSFTFLVDPGRRVYVRRINVVGNTRTRDEVVRREMRQFEGSFFDSQKLQLSKQRIDKTGFFSEVNVETPAVPGTTDQVDVTVRVKEKPTGALMLGIGFSNIDKVILQTSIQQSNFFGTGNTLGAQVALGSVNKVASISFTDPYYTIDGVSRGFDLYRRDLDATNLGLGDYRTSTLGAAVRFGVPFTEYDTLFFGLGMERTRLFLAGDSPQRYLDFANQFGTTYLALISTAGWVRDTRDSFIWPTKGHLERATLEVGTQPGDLEYWKYSYSHQYFYPYSRDFTLVLSGELDAGDGYGGRPLPFFKNYYSGGIGSVRGYRTASLGARDIDGSFLGGNRKINTSAELLFPVPGTTLDRSMRLGVFVDGGQVYAATDKFDLSQMRAAWGMSFAWNSPVGPMKISIAKPLNDKPGDNIQNIQFTLGTVF